jgi:hypothetical protein
VFRSADAAASWAPINSGLPSLDLWSLSIDRTGSLLRAASAVGLFEYQVNGPPLPATVPVIEYFYAAFDHYFITSNPDEISKLDNEGSAGWVRTGLQFNAYAVPNENSVPVCRFFSTAFAPKSSHFYTFLAGAPSQAAASGCLKAAPRSTSQSLMKMDHAPLARRRYRCTTTVRALRPATVHADFTARR